MFLCFKTVGNFKIHILCYKMVLCFSNAVYLFFNYILLIMLLQLSLFFSLYPPPYSTPCPLRRFPHHCSCPWVMHTSTLVTPFPILYFTSHGYSVTTYLYLLIPSPPHPFFDTPLPIWQPSKCSLKTEFCPYSSCLLSLIFRPSC